MDATRTAAVAPAQIAKGALRRLAMAKQEPTPVNYARASAEEWIRRDAIVLAQGERARL